MGYPLVPLNDANVISRYAQAGARELYMGFYDPQWTATFGIHADINRMSGFGREANAYSFQELLQIAQEVKSYGCAFYVTFNTACYNAAMEPWISNYFQQLAWAGADGVILSGPELIDLAHRFGLQAVASTMCGIYNVQIADLYAKWGIDRMILPRDLSLEELRAIIAANPHLEYEVFLMRNGCVFSDSHCLGMHGMGRGALCGEMRVSERTYKTTAKLEHVKGLSDIRRDTYHMYACGLCAIWDLEVMGATAYKVVGRGDAPDAIAEDVALVAANIAVAAQCASRQEYLQRMIRHPYEKTVCDRGFNCYYPELWEGRQNAKDSDNCVARWAYNNPERI